MFEPPKIVLDKESFRALSADTRVSIMHHLGERRRTLTELSQKLMLGPSTIKEHCDILRSVGLIQQVDEGRKWKYYELTKKGKQIISPSLMEDAKVLVTICAAAILFIGFIFIAIQGQFIQGASSVSAELGEKQLASPADTMRATANELSYTAPEASGGTTTQIVQGVPFATVMQALAIALVAGITLGWYVRGKK